MVLKVAKSNETKKPTTPQIEIFNEGKRNQYVNGIELTFDSYFTLYGTVEIVIGDQKILFGNEAEDFKQYRVFPVPVNSEVLKPYESIKIYVWNPLNENIVTLTANVDIHDDPAISTLSGQAIDNDAILSEISGGAGNDADTHDIFPYKIYQDSVNDFLINTKGRQNMLLTMAASSVLPPSVIPNSFTVLPIPSLSFKTLYSADTTPNLQSSTTSVTNNYPSNTGVYGKHYTDYIETYSITDYQNIFNSTVYDDNSALDSKTMQTWIDEIVIIDAITTNAKQLEFNFVNTQFSLSKYTRMRVLNSITKFYSRSRASMRYVQVGATYNYDVSWSSFTTARQIWQLLVRADSPNYTEWRLISNRHPYQIYNYVYPAVLVNYSVSILVDACDDENFISDIDTLSEITTNGLKTYNTTKRYIRLRRQITPGTPIQYNNSDSNVNGLDGTQEYFNPDSPMQTTNLIDKLSHGGSAKLYFQLLGVNNQWFTILDEIELGSITQGDSKLIRYNIAGIPPSQNRFRARMEVVGSLQTGVTIDITS